MSYTITQADILQWAKDYNGPPFHAAFCDAPYEMQFMGKNWDNTGIAFRPETWAAIARHVLPGGFIVSFAGSRGWHRMACAMEDAGLYIHPTIFCWAYGSGFPKATRIDAQVDAGAFRAWLRSNPAEQATLRAHMDDYREARRAGKGGNDEGWVAQSKAALDTLTRALKERAGLAPRVVGQKKHQPKFAAAELGYREKDNGFNSRERETFELTESATALGRDWAGHRYGGQAIKPAVEPVIVAQVPYRGRPVDCITSTGAGAFNIDGARIGTADDMNPRDFDDSRRTSPKFSGLYRDAGTAPSLARDGAVPAGRWPANLALSHHPECNGQCHEACPVRRLGEQSGDLRPGERPAKANAQPGGNGYTMGAGWHGPDSGERVVLDSGTAARYFLNADWAAERLEAADPVGYFAKASSAEREAGLDDMQVRIMRALYNDDEEDEADDWDFGDIDDGHAVYNSDRHTIARCPEHNEPKDKATRGKTYKCGCSEKRRAQFDLTTVDDGRETPIDNPYQRGETTRRNTHPTIKPIALNRWLATLLLPPERYGPRRLLIPFAGAGSEVIGAMLAGWEVVEGIELEAEHVRIAQARIAYWQLLRHRFMNPDAPVKLRPAKAVPAGQLELF